MELFSEIIKTTFALIVFPGGIFVVAFGFFLRGLDRKIAARIQARVGPPILQCFFDTAKLWRKQIMVPKEALRAVFIGLPLVGFCGIALAPLLLPVPGVYQPILGGDLLILFYLLAVPGIVMMLSASASGSVYSSIGFSREMSLTMAYEAPLLLSLVSVALYVGHGTGQTISLSTQEIIEFQQSNGANILQPLLWPAFISYLAALPASLQVTPFDSAEAETEILEGPLLEYSGPLLALIQTMQLILRVVMLSLGIVLFSPGDPQGMLGAVVFILKVVALAAVVVTPLRLFYARFRVEQAMAFILKYPMLIGLLGVILVLWLS